MQASNFKANPYGWLTNQVSHIGLGALVGEKNANEVAYEVGGVELIDPDTIRSPSNVWG